MSAGSDFTASVFLVTISGPSPSFIFISLHKFYVKECLFFASHVVKIKVFTSESNPAFLMQNLSCFFLQWLDSAYYESLCFITDFKTYKHHCVLYIYTGWSTLSIRRLNHWLVFIYKVVVGLLPSSSIHTNWLENIHFVRTCFLYTVI